MKAQVRGLKYLKSLYPDLILAVDPHSAGVKVYLSAMVKGQKVEITKTGVYADDLIMAACSEFLEVTK